MGGRGPGPGAAHPTVQAPPRFAEVGEFLRNRSFVVLLLSGFTMALTQSSLLAYFALYARDHLGYGVVAAGSLLAAAQARGPRPGAAPPPPPWPPPSGPPGQGPPPRSSPSSSAPAPSAGPASTWRSPRK